MCILFSGRQIARVRKVGCKSRVCYIKKKREIKKSSKRFNSLFLRKNTYKKKNTQKEKIHIFSTNDEKKMFPKYLYYSLFCTPFEG